MQNPICSIQSHSSHTPIDRIIRSFLSPSRDAVRRAFRWSIWNPDDHLLILNGLRNAFSALESAQMVPLLRLGCFLRDTLQEGSFSDLSREFVVDLLECIDGFLTAQPSGENTDRQSVRALWILLSQSGELHNPDGFKRIPTERPYIPVNTQRLSSLKYMPSLTEPPTESELTDVETFLIDLEKEYATQDMDRIREWYNTTFPEESGRSDHDNEETPPGEAKDIFDDLF